MSTTIASQAPRFWSTYCRTCGGIGGGSSTTARESTDAPRAFSARTWLQLTGPPATSQVRAPKVSTSRVPTGPATIGKLRLVADSAMPTTTGSSRVGRPTTSSGSPTAYPLAASAALITTSPDRAGQWPSSSRKSPSVAGSRRSVSTASAPPWPLSVATVTLPVRSSTRRSPPSAAPTCCRVRGFAFSSPPEAEAWSGSTHW